MLVLTRLVPLFLIAWLLSFTLASLCHSLYVVNQLVNVGIEVSFDDSARLITDDWLGLLTTYGAIIAIAFALAFWCASYLNNKVKQPTQWVFALAGTGAMAIVLIAIESIMNINIIAGARGWGFYAQLLTGAAGGFVFATLKTKFASS